MSAGTMRRIAAGPIRRAARWIRESTAGQADNFTAVAKTSDAGRKAIAEAVFERIDLLGATAHVNAHGWDAAFAAGIVRVKEGQFGRGERI